MSVITSISKHLLPKLRCAAVCEYKLSSQCSHSWLARCYRLQSCIPPPQYICSQNLHTSASYFDRDHVDLFNEDSDDEHTRGQRGRQFGGGWNDRNHRFGGRSYNNNRYDHGLSEDSFVKEAEPINPKDLIPLKKDFFQPSEEVLQQTDNHENFLQQHKISAVGHDVPPPIVKFSDHPFPEGIARNLAEFDAPFPIQAQGWSIALKGMDMIGIGQTGSGKTLGYLLPGLLHIAHHHAMYKERQQQRQEAPLGLVLAPTRELVQQIMAVALQYGPAVGVRPVAMFGGASRSLQLRNLYSKSSQLVIATPGRLLDFLESKEVLLGRCSFLVLDEADRMLDMGFEPQIRGIVQHTRRDRQTLMWSATWPSEVQDLAASFLTEPVQLSVGSTDLRANPDISQHIHICTQDDKMQMLEELVREMLAGRPDGQAMIFCQTKRAVDGVCFRLQKKGFRARSIHGDKSQQMRDTVLTGFRQKQISVLVATDVAARGIDVPSLTCVVNYDFPQSGVEDYIHRIGRTGRQGNKGYAHSFFTEDDAQHARKLVKVLQDAEQPVSEELKAMATQNVSTKKVTGHHRVGGTHSSYGGNSFRRPSYGGGRSTYQRRGNYDDDDFDGGWRRGGDGGFGGARGREGGNRRRSSDW